MPGPEPLLAVAARFASDLASLAAYDQAVARLRDDDAGVSVFRGALGPDGLPVVIALGEPGSAAMLGALAGLLAGAGGAPVALPPALLGQLALRRRAQPVDGPRLASYHHAEPVRLRVA